MTRSPLSWPPGWRRTRAGLRKDARFSQDGFRVTIAGGTRRVLQQLTMLGVREGDAIISTHLTIRLDGLPYSDQKEPADPGVAVYWKHGKDTAHKVMAIDCYSKVADNLAAIAATLDAMRAIERHGGAVILERAFLGFQCLPMPNTWRAVVGLPEDSMVTIDYVKDLYRARAKTRHPDNGGTDREMSELNWAMDEAAKELT